MRPNVLAEQLAGTIAASSRPSSSGSASSRSPAARASSPTPGSRRPSTSSPAPFVGFVSGSTGSRLGHRYRGRTAPQASPARPARTGPQG